MVQGKILKRAFIAVLAGLFISGCVSGPALKTMESVLEQRRIDISGEELSQWENLAKNGKDSMERSRGAFWAGQYYMNKKEYKKAVKYFSHNEKYYIDLEWGYLSVYRKAEIYIDVNNIDDAVSKIKVLAEKKHQFPGLKSAVTSSIEKLIKALAPEQLEELYQKHIHAVIDENILYVLSKKAFEQSDYTGFFKYARVFLSEFSESEMYDEIAKKFKEAVKYRPVNNRKVGVIIPMSGKSMDVGRVVKNGLEMGLAGYNEEKDEGEKVSLLYIDEALPGLEENIQKAIEEESVIAFIGPLYSKTVKRIIPLLERYNTALFSPTASQPGLSEESKYFFRNCGTAKGQAFAMANYVSAETEFEKISTLFPDNAYGQSLNKYFVERHLKNGREIARAVSYPAGASDYKKQMVLLGGVDAILLKEKRAGEKRDLNNAMENAGKKILEKIINYMTLYDDGSGPNREIPKIKIALLHLAPLGKNISGLEIDKDMTYKLSYTIARDKNVKVIKQAVSNMEMENIGVGPEDVDREIALSIAHRLDTDVLIFGQVEEIEPEIPADSEINTVYSNFLPEQYVDEDGVTRTSYNFRETDYHHFKVNIYVVSVTDEMLIEEIKLSYKKIKPPMVNPLEIDALYIPASERKIILIKDQLKFYDFDLPVFGSSALAGNYIKNFRDSAAGIIYPVEFYPEDEDYAVREFVDKYRDRYASSTNVIAANSYDLMKIMCALIDRNIDSRENFKNVLKGVRNYVGVTGKFSFDADGDSVKDYYIMKMEKNGPEFLRKIRGE